MSSTSEFTPPPPEISPAYYSSEQGEDNTWLTLDPPSLPSGEPTGSIIKVGKYDAYVAEPKGDKKHDGAALLYIPDVFGIWENSKLMVDQFAANGYYTILVDVFNGDALTLDRPAGFDIMKWLGEGSDGKNPHTKEAVDPIVELSLKWLKEQGFTKIGALGYCFGAKVSLCPRDLPNLLGLRTAARARDADLLSSPTVRRSSLQGRYQGRLHGAPLLCRRG